MAFDQGDRRRSMNDHTELLELDPRPKPHHSPERALHQFLARLDDSDRMPCLPRGAGDLAPNQATTDDDDLALRRQRVSKRERIIQRT